MHTANTCKPAAILKKGTTEQDTVGESRSQDTQAVVPVAGLVSAALIREAGAHEHVFVDASTQAVDVRHHIDPGLHDGKNDLQGLGAIAGLVSPGGTQLDFVSGEEL